MSSFAGKKIAFKVLILTFIMGMIAMQSYALDYPHSTTNNIGCDSCHFVYGTQPSLLPPWTEHVPQDIDDTQYNTLCWSCHNDIDAPYMRTHSSLQIDNDYGDWTVDCKVCHNPHYQKQFRTYGSASYLYSGTSTGITSTTLTKTDAEWTVDRYKNLVVVPNVLQKNYNYKILSNTADTLTVQGPINLAKVIVGNTFAILYGKLETDAVDLSKITITPAKRGSKTVRLFNATGDKSFADGDTTYDGVCEACHTQTTHFKSDGTGPDQLHANMGFPAGTKCTNCHYHVNGFRGMGGGAHTTHVIKGYGPQLDCADCHGANVPPILADGQNLANTLVCNGCHSVSGAAIAKQYWSSDGSSEGKSGSWATVESETSFCGSCHDATPGNTRGDGSGDTAANVMGDNSTYGYSIVGHGKASGNYPKLSWQASSAIGNPAANRQCSACHSLTSQHFNNSGKRLKPGYENDNNNSNCIQCHDQNRIAIADPQWYTNHNDYQNSAHNTRKCSACHDVHGASGNYPGMTRANQESLCYQCHTEGVVQNVAISGALIADDIQQAFNLANKHNLGTSFTISGSNYTLECVSCHNVHIITGKYWQADQGKSPLTRFTNNTAVWGVSSGQKMSDYAGTGTYQTPVGDTFNGAQLPDYPSFCQDCHGTGGTNHNSPEPSPYFRLTWDNDPHGKKAAGPPATSYQGGSCNCPASYPDWEGVGYTDGETDSLWPSSWRVPRSRGYMAFTFHPYDQEKRIKGDNFVLSCTDCHEAHGSNSSKMQRSVRTQEAGPGVPNNCSVCHYTYASWHQGMSCGSASCHVTNGIHRIQHGGGSGAFTFDGSRPAYIKFDGEQYDVTDSGTWKNHGRWLKNNAPVNSGSFSTGVDGLTNHAAVFDGSSDMAELGTRQHYNYFADETSTSNKRNTYRYFEMKNNVTLQAWIKTEQLGGKRVIMSNEIADANYSFSIRDDVPGETGSRLVFQLYLQDSPNQWRGAYSSVSIITPVWTHVAATYDASATDGKRIKVFVNGQDVTANTGTAEYAQPSTDAEIMEGSAVTPTALKQRFVIGAHPDGAANFFKGRIDEVNVYNVTRTQTQIETDATIAANIVTLSSAIASDTSGGGPDIQDGDKAVVLFSGETNAPEITKDNINAVLVLSNGHSWLDGSGNIISAVWSANAFANDTLTITLSAGGGQPSAAFNDTITVNNGVITDIYGRTIDSSTTLIGTFGINMLSGASAYWPLNEGTGGAAIDYTGNGNVGTLKPTYSSNSPVWSSGRIGNALTFDGTNDYVDCGNGAGLNFERTDPFTLETWIRFDRTTDWNTKPDFFFTKMANAVPYNGIQIFRWTDNKINFALINNFSGNNYLQVISTETVSPGTGTWYHIVVTYDGSTDANNVKMYWNGALKSVTMPKNALSASILTTQPWRLGIRGTNNYPFKGIMDEVVIYNRALSPEEVWARYNTIETDLPAIFALSPANGAVNVPVNSNLTFNLSDSGSGIDWDTFSMQLAGNMGYSAAYSGAGPQVSKTGTLASYDVTVNPDADFGSSELVTVAVNAKDWAGNALVPPAWSFTAMDLSSIPAAPTIGTPAAPTPASIRWHFTDNATNEKGFKVHDGSHSMMVSSATQDLAYLDETGLTANTQYTRHIHAYNPIGDSTGSADASRYTLSPVPNVTSDKSLSTWYNTTDVVFTNAAGFGGGAVQYYRYVWDQNAVYTFSDTETQWTTGTLTKTATASSGWYLHVRSYNAEDVANSSVDYGPYYYDNSAPSSSNLSPANSTTGAAVTSNLTLTVSDAHSGIDWTSFSIQLTGDKGYSKIYTDLDTSIVTKTGTSAIYDITVDPDADFSGQEVISVTVNVNDTVGNSLTSPAWSFTTGNSILSGAAAYWRHNDGTSGSTPQTAADSAGSNTCTLGSTSGADANDPVWTTSGQAGNALYFNGNQGTPPTGTYQYAQCGTNSVFDFTPGSKFTIEGWFKFSETGVFRELISKMGQNWTAGEQYFRGWHIYKPTDNYIYFALIDSFYSGTPRYYVQRRSASTISSTSSFYHIVVTYDGHAYPGATGNDISIYINGSPGNGTVSDLNPSNVQTTTNSFPVRIGMRGDGSNGYPYPYKGTIDEVLIYNRVLTPSEVLDRYNLNGQ